MAKITINGEQVKVKKGTTILQAANELGIEIPTLCFIEEINEIGFCRICVVEVEGEQDLVSACNTEVQNGMVIETDSDKVIESREASLALLASRHRFDCWRCPKDGMCEFYDLLKEHDIEFEEFGPGIPRKHDLIEGTAIMQDQSKCVLCKRCVAVCQTVVTANVLKFHDDDGLNPVVSPAIGLSFDETGCIHCGQCVKTCPTGTLYETDHTDRVLTFLKEADGHVVVQLDKQAGSAIAEEFGYPIDTPLADTIGKTYEALELLGFDTVTNLDLGEDLHAIETANQLIERLEQGSNLPLFTSGCAATVSYFEQHKPAYLDHLATVKSPHMLSGGLLKHDLLQRPDAKVVTVSTCTAKKYELSRPELALDGVPHVDAALTVRELTKLMKQKGIAYRRLEGKHPDNEFTTDDAVYRGGTLMAVLNATSERLTGQPVPALTFKRLRGETETDGVIDEAMVTIGDKKLRVARVMGGAAFAEMFDRMSKKDYHLIEFLICPGGCLNGGGMPIRMNVATHDVIAARQTAHCATDAPATNPMHNTILAARPEGAYADLVHTSYAQQEFRKE
jgi:iron only hydrogenase large subunit-like protein/ferredoxin